MENVTPVLKSNNPSNPLAPSCEASSGLQNKQNSQTSGSTRVESRNQHIFEASIQISIFHMDTNVERKKYSLLIGFLESRDRQN